MILILDPDSMLIWILSPDYDSDCGSEEVLDLDADLDSDAGF